MARVISENKLKTLENSTNVEEINLLMKNLAKVYLRLGDLQLWKENLDDSLQEYIKCLKIREKSENLYYSRDLSEM